MIKAALVAKSLIHEVDEAIARVLERISRDPSKDWLTLAQDESVRESMHEATRILSGRDGDMASVRNNLGWSRSHSSAWHVLASEEILLVIQATQALAAVHRHRKQVPDELRMRIFGAAHF